MHSFVIQTGLAMHKLKLSVHDIKQLNIVELKQKYREVCNTLEIELCQYCTFSGIYRVQVLQRKVLKFPLKVEVFA